MDKNKLKVLRQVDYVVPKHCGICAHADFGPGQSFGECRLHRYRHLKHAGPARNLSILRHGSCRDFQLDEGKLVALGGFAELVDRRAHSRSSRHKQKTSI